MRHKMLTNYFLVEPCNSPSQKEILFNSSSMCLYTFFFILVFICFIALEKNEFGSFKLFFVPLPVVRDVHSVSLYFFWGWLISLKAKVKRQQNKRQAIGAWGDSMGHCLVQWHSTLIWPRTFSLQSASSPLQFIQMHDKTKSINNKLSCQSHFQR